MNNSQATFNSVLDDWKALWWATTSLIHPKQPGGLKTVTLTASQRKTESAATLQATVSSRNSAVNNNNVMSLGWSRPKKSINPVIAGRRLHRAAETVWFNLFINSLTTKLTGWEQRVGLWKQLATYFQARLDKKLLTGCTEFVFLHKTRLSKRFCLDDEKRTRDDNVTTTKMRQRWDKKTKHKWLLKVFSLIPVVGPSGFGHLEPWWNFAASCKMQQCFSTANKHSCQNQSHPSSSNNVSVPAHPNQTVLTKF